MTGEDANGSSQTESGEPQDLAPAPASMRMYLVIDHRGGLEVRQLRSQQSLVVGRGAPADITIRDPKLSKRHVEFVGSPEGVIVRDLESRNGTWIDGERTTERIIKAGSEVLVGDTHILVRSAKTTEDEPASLAGHDSFLTAIGTELGRARHFNRGFAILMMRSSNDNVRPMELATRLRALLRPIDTAAVFGRGLIEILMPELTETQAKRLAQTIADDLRARVGISFFPGSASSPEELLSVARDALESATDNNSVALAEAVEKRNFGRERSRSSAPVAGLAMRKIQSLVDRVASSEVPVLITGETGVGKEVLAHAIHQRGDRSGGPIHCVNCAAIPSQLVESTLFGHEKGAFTGALQQRIGAFEAAHGGTLMLDEVGELPAAAQAALLRVLETKRILRVGSTQEIEVDTRILAATHRNLEEMCNEGTFRWDLYYRLNVMIIEIPPLRERVDEIPMLATRFIENACRRDHREPCTLSEAALQLLTAYSWPGNVRELKNVIERAVLMSNESVIGTDELPERMGKMPPATAPNAQPEEEPSGLLLKQRLEEYETRMIVDALKASSGNQRAAAEKLGVPLRTLVRKIQLLGVRKEYGAK